MKSEAAIRRQAQHRLKMEEKAKVRQHLKTGALRVVAADRAGNPVTKFFPYDVVSVPGKWLLAELRRMHAGQVPGGMRRYLARQRKRA